MPLIRIVPPSDRKCTYAGTFLIKCKEFSNFFCNYDMKHLHIKKCDKCNKVHRTCVSTYTLSCSCIVHIKAYFVWHDGNCTALTCIKFGNHYICLRLHIHICVNSSCHVCFTVVLCNKRHCSKIAVLLLQNLVFYFRCGSPQKKTTSHVRSEHQKFQNQWPILIYLGLPWIIQKRLKRFGNMPVSIFR